VNNEGQVVGYSFLPEDEACHAFAYDGNESQLYDLNEVAAYPGWYLREALAVNGNGYIVGNMMNQSGQTHAFLATPNVPEPASCVLLALAAGGIGAMLRRRHKR